MVQFKTTINKFAEKGEKSGWTYIHIPAIIAQQIVPGTKKAFRVKGYLDDYCFEGISLVPMGGGDFILPLKASIRKAIYKSHGAEVKVKIEHDSNTVKPPSEFTECLADEPKALEQFNRLPMGHRNYFYNWISSAKTEVTKAKRIAASVNSLAKGWGYGEMIRSMKKDKEDLMQL